MKGFVTLVLPAFLALAMSAPAAQPQEDDGNPFTAIGNFIQRLQSSFNEGSESIRQNQENGLYPIAPPESASSSSGNETTVISLTTTTGKPTTTPRTTTTPPSQRPRPTNPFDSINAILDNISRGSSNNNNVPLNNNIFGNVPGRNLPDPIFSTSRPLFPQSAPPTRPPFSLDGISQGINAFFQTFIKTNIDNLFKRGVQDQEKHTISARSDTPRGTPPPSIVDAIIKAFIPPKSTDFKY